MKTIALDVHSKLSQMAVVTEDGEVLLELQVATTADELRRVVSGVGGPKQVVMEEGPMSAMIVDALTGVADTVVSCDPTKNALIARSDNSDDEHDARRLAHLARTNMIHEIYQAPEPFRNLRSLMHHDYKLSIEIARPKNALKALCRRIGIRYSKRSLYPREGRLAAAKQIGDPGLRWQFESLWRQMNLIRLERVRASKIIRRQARKLPVVARLQTIPGIARTNGPVLASYIVDPKRFRTRSALASYAGLGISSDRSNWKDARRSRASKRGNRELKRALFIAARTNLRMDNALRARYDARIASGWEDSKAIRDIARTILRIACAIWEKGEYDDALVSVPVPTRRDR